MSLTPAKSEKRCPYWSDINRKCKLSGSGLFIPQEDHTEMFCTTRAYPKCLLFMLHSENQLEIAEKGNASLRNRRRYTRLKARHVVKIDKVIRSDQPVTQSSIAATTLDLSMGGVRLATDKSLESDTIVQILFDDPFPENLHSATGQVSWCNKQIDEPGYQVGISFKSDKVIQAMGNFLNLQ